jgi:hypothetical protein
MKNPLNVDIYIEPGLSPRGRNVHNVYQKGLNKAQSPVTFVSLLLDTIEKSNKRDGPDNTLPIGRDHLQRLIDAVKLQMNDYLLRELSDFDEGNQDAGVSDSQRKWLNDYGIDDDAASFVSKIEQKPQRTREIASLSDIDDIIKHASNTHEVDPKLIKAVIRAESDFDAGATSSKGAMGLMQLMPGTAKELGVKNCYNPVENIMAGTRYLKSLLNRYDGNVELTLAAYNWGMGNVERRPDRLPQETRTYIARVHRFLQKEI